MNYIISKLKKNNDLLTLLIILLPIFIIIGNLAINLSCLLIIILGVKKFSQEFIKYLNLFKAYLIILFIFIILNIIFSSDYILSLRGILGIIKYILLSTIIFFWLNNKKDNFSLLCVSILLSILLVSISVFIEFNYKNIFGLINNRNSGIFFGEQIAGSYISKFIFAMLVFLILDIQKLKLNRISVYLILIFCYLGIFLAMGRSSFIITNLGFLFYLFFTKKIKLSSKFIIILGVITIIFTSYNFNTSIKLKSDYTLYQLGFKRFIGKELLKKFEGETVPGVAQNNIYDNFLESKWGSHFITAYEMGKKSFIIGNGIKTFRKDCGKDEFLSKEFNQGSVAKRCATHPHNIYFELFGEAGTLGLLIFFYCHFMVLKKIYENKNRELKIILFSIFIILFFPLQTTGSYFSTFNGIFYFLNLSIINFLCSNKKLVFEKTIKL